MILTTHEHTETLFIDNPKHIQHYHVENMISHLRGLADHPSQGESAAKTNWVMDQILGR